MAATSMPNGRINPSNMEKKQSEYEDVWIPKHIKRRICCRFQPPDGSRSSDPLCGCGYSRGEHDPEALNQAPLSNKWAPGTHTKVISTAAFGEIEFQGFGQKRGKYICVSHDTDMRFMIKLLSRIWKLESPNLLISVTGGASKFHMKPRLKEVFRKGITKITRDTGAWITSAGTHAGVMKHIGEAIRDLGLASQKKAVAIGIAPWGCIQNKETLISQDGRGKYPARYRVEAARHDKGETLLDPNHSHFILVDNGTQHEYATEIKFRASLENAISSELKTDSGGLNASGVKVPIVLLVLEGGPGTLETVYSSIQKGTPAVIVAGSGRAADILAYAIQNSVEQEIEVTDQEGNHGKKILNMLTVDAEVEVTSRMRKIFGESELSTRVGWLKESIQNTDLITVFQLDSQKSAKELDLAILKALFKANKDQVLDQLRLSLAWNRIDVAKSEIFTDDREWKTGVLDDVMVSALLLNRYDFVALFLEHGVSLRNFLTASRLEDLYNQMPKNCLLYNVLEKKLPMDSVETVGRLIQDLMGDFYHPLYLRMNKDKDGKVKTEKYIALNDVPSSISSGRGIPLTKTRGEDDEVVSMHKRPARELFIWAVLMNRHEMAKLFWEEGKESIPSALVACKLLKSLRSNTEDPEILNELNQRSQYYEDLAVSVLNECYNDDKDRSLSLLVRQLHYWGKSTCVEIASEGGNKKFISQAACQNLLNTIWIGQISPKNNIMFVMFCVVCPFFLFFLKFDPPEPPAPEDTTGSSKEHEDDNHYEEDNVNNASSHEDLTAAKTDVVPVRRKVSPWMKVKYFFSAPMISFAYNVVFYLAFLLLYSYVMLIDFGDLPTIPEYILIAWVATLNLEELRQLFTNTSHSFYRKILRYWNDYWNRADLFIIILFILGVVLRFFPDTLEAARVILAVVLVLYYLRLLHIFSIEKHLGPKLIMIQRMVVDLMYFFVILFVFIVGYGVASESILSPKVEFEPQILYTILRKAYWQMYGELFLEDLEGDNCDLTDLTTPCPSEVAQYVVPILLGFYMLFTNILLLNLLIAMFSYTFTKIQENTDLHWYFQRYSLIYEYYERPLLPPPLIIFSHIYIILKKCSTCCRKNRMSEGFLRQFNRMELKTLRLWEDVNRDEYLRKTQIMEMERVDTVVKTNSDKLDVLIIRADELQGQQVALRDSFGNALPSSEMIAPTPMEAARLSPKLEARLERLEDKVIVTYEALDWIIRSLQENNMGCRSTPPPEIPNLRKEKEKENRHKEDQARKEREMVKKMMEKRIQVHFKSRTSPYPGSNTQRFPIPDEKVLWEISFPEYNPVEYVSKEVQDKPDWADPIDLLACAVGSRPALPFNRYDDKVGVDRISYMFPYIIKDGVPMNPRGRTGLVGRGLLGRWGPNHAGDPIITRWKLDGHGKRVYENEKPVLEFVAVQRKDNNQWSLPGGFAAPNESIVIRIQSEFTEEALGSLMDDPHRKTVIQQKLNKLFAKGVDIYSGYIDDPRNTDNAWIETRAINYHDEDGSIFSHFTLRAGASEENVTWLSASAQTPLYSSHSALLQKVTDMRNAAF